MAFSAGVKYSFTTNPECPCHPLPLAFPRIFGLAFLWLTCYNASEVMADGDEVEGSDGQRVWKGQECNLDSASRLRRQANSRDGRGRGENLLRHMAGKATLGAYQV
jgi:hypothetical protein